MLVSEQKFFFKDLCCATNLLYSSSYINQEFHAVRFPEAVLYLHSPASNQFPVYSSPFCHFISWYIKHNYKTHDSHLLLLSYVGHKYFSIVENINQKICFKIE